MAHLITLENVSLAYGLEPLLDKVKLQISEGERICLIGRNGTGKSSLLKIIEGHIQPDTGQVWRRPTLRLSRLEQELPKETEATVYEFVAAGLAGTGKLLADYHALTHKMADSHSQADLTALEKLQNKIDSVNGWHFENDISSIIDRLQLDRDQPLNKLSGGWQRRAALAKALVSSPDLLLLDEPTNHLDIHAIQWLEEQLLSCGSALLFITHDRALLRRLATRILELDRGQLTSWPENYDNYLLHKEEQLQAEAKHHADFDKKLAQEEVWIRQGIKARRTRNEGRVRELEALRLMRSKRREQQNKVTFTLNQAEKSGQLVIEAHNISHQFNHTPIIKDFSMRIMRGDRIGFIGPNGVGKSTLLNLLLETLVPQKGKVVQGTKLQIAYFDQLRQTLDLEKTVLENVAEGREIIEINGRQQHIISYLNDFLFTSERTMTPVKALSGGECNRLLIARLFSQPSNLLILDEPTNDLDIETLELLEDLLMQYQGTLLLVSHDREFLDHVVTSTLAFEGNAIICEYIGGYQDYLHQKPKIENVAPQKNTVAKIQKNSEKIELEALPKKIDILEKEQQALHQLMTDPEFYKNNQVFITEKLDRLKWIESQLKKSYERWGELEK